MGGAEAGGEGEAMVRGLQGTRLAVDEKLERSRIQVGADELGWWIESGDVLGGAGHAEARGGRQVEAPAMHGLVQQARMLRLQETHRRRRQVLLGPGGTPELACAPI